MAEPRKKTVTDAIIQAGLKAFIVITVWLLLLGIVGAALFGYIPAPPGSWADKVVTQAWGFIMFIAGIAIGIWLFGAQPPATQPQS